MSLAQHLVELRKRILISVIGLIVAMVVSFILTDPIIAVLIQPINDIAERTGKAALNIGTVTGGFDMRMRIAFSLGIFLSVPVWLSQIWLFVMPALTRREIGYAIGFLAAAVPLFFSGCAVGLMIFPHIVEIMSTLVPGQVQQLFAYESYMDFIMKLLLVIGVAFVLPVFLVLLNVAGVISGRSILKGWRVAVLVSTLFAAVATPAADVFSMVLLAGILVVLYVAAALVALLFDRRRHRREKALLVESGTAS